MSLRLYDDALTSGAALRVRLAGGAAHDLPVARWAGGLDAADRRLVDGLAGPVLDVGCGPGRLVAAATRRGLRALGLDVSPAAVRLTRARGAAALRADVFGPVPDPGCWGDVLLADGNVGIGGDPARLLARLAGLLADGGRVHVEVAPPGAPSEPLRARLETAAGDAGEWFGWASLSADGAADAAAAAGLRLGETWEEGGRWFAVLAR